MSRPVLVLGWIPRIVVAVARSLHKHNVTVDVADFTESPRPVSRAIRQFRRLPHPDSDPAAFVSELLDFIRQGGHNMLIPTDDQALIAATEHYNDLQNHVYIACPPPDITHRVLNKIETLDIARKCGICVPNTKVISNSAQLSGPVPGFPFPFVLKPSGKEVRIEEVKSYTLRSANEVAAKFPSAREFTPPMLLQEYCPGEGVGIEILLNEGKCVAVFQHRRLEEYPYGGGVSVTAISEQPDPVLVEKSLSLLRALQWNGPAMVEYKVDRENGSAVLMEVNGRYWGTVSLPILSGIEFPLYHWQMAHGESPIAGGDAPGIKWRWTAGHLLRFHGLVLAARRSTLARKELWRSLSELPALFDSSTCDALQEPSDPMPAILDLFHISKFLFLDDVRMLFKRFSHHRQFVGHQPETP